VVERGATPGGVHLAHAPEARRRAALRHHLLPAPHAAECAALLGDLLPDEGLPLRGGALLDLSADIVRTSPEIVAEAECDFTVSLPGVQPSILRFGTGAAVAVRDADVGLRLDLQGEVGTDGTLKTVMVPLDPDAPPARRGRLSSVRPARHHLGRADAALRPAGPRVPRR